MQFLPWAMFCQNSSRFLACGNWPAMPITAIGWAEWEACGTWEAVVVQNRADLRLREEVSFSPANFIAVFDCDEATFFDAAGLSATGAACLNSVPSFSASSLS